MGRRNPPSGGNRVRMPPSLRDGLLARTNWRLSPANSSPSSSVIAADAAPRSLGVSHDVNRVAGLKGRVVLDFSDDFDGVGGSFALGVVVRRITPPAGEHSKAAWIDDEVLDVLRHAVAASERVGHPIERNAVLASSEDRLRPIDEDAGSRRQVGSDQRAANRGGRRLRPPHSEPDPPVSHVPPQPISDNFRCLPMWFATPVACWSPGRTRRHRRTTDPQRFDDFGVEVMGR